MLLSRGVFRVPAYEAGGHWFVSWEVHLNLVDRDWTVGVISKIKDLGT